MTRSARTNRGLANTMTYRLPISIAAFAGVLAIAMIAAIPAKQPTLDEASQTLKPITVITGQLTAVGGVQLLDDTALPSGTPLLGGDIVVDGAMINEGTSTALVLAGEAIVSLQPGAILTAVGTGTPARRCACKCGTGWKVLNTLTANCATTPPNVIGEKCIDPLTQQPATWTECMDVYDIIASPPSGN